MLQAPADAAVGPSTMRRASRCAAIVLGVHSRAKYPIRVCLRQEGIRAVAAMLSLLLLERVLHHIVGARLLPWLTLVALAGLAAFLLAPNLWIASAALAVTSAGAVGWYPIARAAAYACCPGRPGVARTVLSITAPLELALLGLAGLLAAHFGIRAGIAVFTLAPLIVVLLAPHRGAERGAT